MKYLLTDENYQTIKSFEGFNKDLIKTEIIKHLTAHNTSEVYLEKEAHSKKYYGSELLNSYGVNPKNGTPSLIIDRGSKRVYKSLI